jgi:dipeptidase E
MLLLTSNGLSSDQLIARMKDICCPMTRAAIVTTASVGYKENDWHIPRLTGELQQLGLGVDYFDFDVQRPDRLLEYDVVEFIGGNPFYLLDSMRRVGAREILKTLANERVIIGISAGSIIMQQSIALVAQFSPELNKGINLTDLSGFGLTQIEILPHYSKYLSKFERFEERAQKYEAANNINLIRINDGQGVIAGFDSYEII